MSWLFCKPRHFYFLQKLFTTGSGYINETYRTTFIGNHFLRQKGVIRIIFTDTINYQL